MTHIPSPNPSDPCGSEASTPPGLSPSAEPPPQLRQHPVRIGPLLVQPNTTATLRGQTLSNEALGLVIKGPVQTFLVERARGEIPLPDEERFLSLATGDVEWPETTPVHRGERPARTPLVTVDRARIRDAIDAGGLGTPTLGLANLSLSPALATALVPWDRLEAATRTAIAKAGGDYDPARVRCYDCGFDGALVVVAPPKTDPLAVETPPEAIEAAVFVRPVVAEAGVAEREPDHAPQTDATATPCSPDSDHERRLIEQAGGDAVTASSGN